MAGNSQRRGSVRKSSKKPPAGSGGRVRRGLEGKGPTPKAKDRPNHKAYKAKQQAYFNAGKCALQGGRLDRAEQYLRQGVELAPQDPLLLALLADVKFRQGDFMAARAFFQRRESLGAPSAELLDLAVRIEQGAGDTVAADRYRRRLNEQFPNYTPPAAEGTRQP